MTASRRLDADEEVFDVLSIGFGPAALAIAVALAEHNSGSLTPSTSVPKYSSLGGLQDALARATVVDDEETSGGETRVGKVKACFIERHDEFRWHPGMMLEGSRMQISFLKDLSTLRSPQSPYTFLNYLHSISPSRLLSFISLSTFTPTRREYADYLSWAAQRVQLELQRDGGAVAFGEEVTSVEPVIPSPSCRGSKPVQLLRVSSRSRADGTVRHRLTRNLVVSTGGSPRIPPQLLVEGLRGHKRIFHSSTYLEKIDDVLVDVAQTAPQDRPIRLAVLGGGQSAAEVFLNLRSALARRLEGRPGREDRAETVLFIRKSSLRPTDDSPFSNEVFDPGMSGCVYGLDQKSRDRVMREAKATNYSIVNPETLSKLYEEMYSQKIEEDIATRRSHAPPLDDPKLIIRPYTTLAHASASSSSAISLTFTDVLTGEELQSLEFDAVVCGTGYERQAWSEILFPSAPPASTISLGSIFSSAVALPSAAHFSSLRPKSVVRSASSGTSSSESHLSSSEETPLSTPPTGNESSTKATRSFKETFGVARNYKLQLPKSYQVANGPKGEFRPSVWLQGSNEATHGISDSLLSVLAVRATEVVTGMLKEGNWE